MLPLGIFEFYTVNSKPLLGFKGFRKKVSSIYGATVYTQFPSYKDHLLPHSIITLILIKTFDLTYNYQEHEPAFLLA
jgi:hypothetical protein